MLLLCAEHDIDRGMNSEGKIAAACRSFDFQPKTFTE